MAASAPRLVLIPGLGLDSRSSARLRRSLPADVMTLPGMGVPAPVPSLDELAAQLRGRLGEEPVVLVGHSQSCQVVAAAAVGGGPVRAAVLLGPTTDPRLRRKPRLVLRWLATALREPAWQLRLVLVQYGRTGPRGMVGLWRSASPDRIEERLNEVTVPVTVVRGARDRLCDADWAAVVAAAAPAGDLVEIPGAAHMTVQTHPKEVAAVLRDVLARVSGPR